MHKRKLIKYQENGNEYQESRNIHDDDDNDNDDDDNDYDDLNYCDKSIKNCNNNKNKYSKPNYEYYSSESESEHDHCSKKSKKNDDGGDGEVSDWNGKDSNLDVIVNAVLDELRGMERVDKFSSNNDDSMKSFSHEIDQYLKHNHTKRNSYLTSHESFQKKLKKLMKSMCNVDERDETIPKFTDTEKTIMKIFYKGKQGHHDTRFMMVENIYLNILRKISKYLKKI